MKDEAQSCHAQAGEENSGACGSTVGALCGESTPPPQISACNARTLKEMRTLAEYDDKRRYSTTRISPGELLALLDRLESYQEAIALTIARADDYGDSYITRPIRDLPKASTGTDKA